MEGLLDSQVSLASSLAAALWQSIWLCSLLAILAAFAFTSLCKQSPTLRHNIGIGFLLAMIVVPAWTFYQELCQPAASPNVSILPRIVSDFGMGTNGVQTRLSNWDSILCGLWLVGVFYMLVRHLGGLWWLSRLERRFIQPLPTIWQDRLNHLQSKIGITRNVLVQMSRDVIVPFTARLFQPIIWFPQTLLDRLPHQQIEALLAHELAHIHRLDWLWNGLQCLVETLLFFHPGVWWLNKRVREERELACDALAVKACGNCVSLAEALMSLASEQKGFPKLVLAAKGGTLRERISHLLSPANPAVTRSWSPIVLLGLLIAGFVFVTQLSASSVTTSSKIPRYFKSVDTTIDARPQSKRNSHKTQLNADSRYAMPSTLAEQLPTSNAAYLENDKTAPDRDAIAAHKIQPAHHVMNAAMPHSGTIITEQWPANEPKASTVMRAAAEKAERNHEEAAVAAERQAKEAETTAAAHVKTAIDAEISAQEAEIAERTRDEAAKWAEMARIRADQTKPYADRLEPIEPSPLPPVSMVHPLNPVILTAPAVVPARPALPASPIAKMAPLATRAPILSEAAPVSPVPAIAARKVPRDSDMSEASRTLARLAGADPRIASQIGTNSPATPNSFTGHWGADHNTGAYKEVSLSFILQGPQGQARVWASAVRDETQWRLTGLNLREFSPNR